MLNKLLELQVQKYLEKPEELPSDSVSFLEVVSATYDKLEKKSIGVEISTNVNSEQIKELNRKLRNEAEELKKAHNELGRILNSVNYGFFSRDMTTNKYTYLSEACERIYGYPVREFFENDKLWYHVIHPDDKEIIKNDEERLNNKEELDTQYRIIHKDQSIRWLEFKIIPFFKDGKLNRIDGVVSDITRRKQVEAERELIIKELLKSNTDLKQFSFITSHNLRSPLSNILAILNLLQYSEMGSDNIEMLDMLKVSAKQLSKTIDDLTKILIIKNNVNAELGFFDLQNILDEVILTFSPALKHVGGTMEVNFNSLSIYHNKVYLESIFVNLLSNAIKYRSPSRSLLIKIESSEDENGNVIVSFADNGTGIDLKRHKDKVFGLYQRFHDKIEGQGLGLFIMKSQIEVAGGRIDIESEPDKGTTFIITFKKRL